MIRVGDREYTDPAVEIEPRERILRVEVRCPVRGCHLLYQVFRICLDTRERRAAWFTCRSCKRVLTLRHVTGVLGDNTFPVVDTQRAMEQKVDQYNNWYAGVREQIDWVYQKIRSMPKYKESTIIDSDAAAGLPDIRIKTSVHSDDDEPEDFFIPQEIQHWEQSRKEAIKAHRRKWF